MLMDKKYIFIAIIVIGLTFILISKYSPILFAVAAVFAGIVLIRYVYYLAHKEGSL